MADDDYDVFAGLNDTNDEEGKIFLATLAQCNADLDSDDNLDDLLLPGKLLNGRTKKTKSSAKKLPESKQASPAKSAPQSKTKAPKELPVSPEEPAATNAAAPRRSTRSSKARAEPAPAPAEVTTQRATPKGQRGRKSKNQSTDVAAVPAPAPAPAPATAIVDVTVPDPTNAYDVLMNAGAGGSRRRVMRARRDYFAEIAARSTNVDYVDLVSSPMPRIEGVINVDSDDETVSSNSVVPEKVTNVNTNDTLERSFDEENPEMSIKIKWNGANAEIFKLRKHQKFLHIFNQLAERENTSIESLVFNIDNRIISPDDSPDSINYKIYEFITGRVLTTLLNCGTRKRRNADTIHLKVQSDLWPKRPLKVELRKTDTFRVLYIKCAEELDMPSEKLLLSFDGEHLDRNATLSELEFEGGEVVDLRVKKQ